MGTEHKELTYTNYNNTSCWFPNRWFLITFIVRLKKFKRKTFFHKPYRLHPPLLRSWCVHRTFGIPAEFLCASHAAWHLQMHVWERLRLQSLMSAPKLDQRHFNWDKCRTYCPSFFWSRSPDHFSSLWIHDSMGTILLCKLNEQQNSL